MRFSGCRRRPSRQAGRLCGIKCNSGMNGWQAQVQRREHGSRPEWADHFRVAGINNEKIRLVLHHILDHGQQHMRVDCRDAGVDNFELHFREAFAEHDFEVAGKSVARVGIAPGDRLAEYENPVGPRRFSCRNYIWTRLPKSVRREKRRGKRLIIAISRVPLVGAGTHDSRWGAYSASAEQPLGGHDQ